MCENNKIRKQINISGKKKQKKQYCDDIDKDEKQLNVEKRRYVFGRKYSRS